MSGSRRVFKVAEKIRELVARHLLELGDPRFHLVTVTGATITADLGEARIYWNVAGAERIGEVERAFEGAAGHFRHLLADELGLRVVPRLRFFYDETLDAAQAVERLFERLKKEESAA